MANTSTGGRRGARPATRAGGKDARGPEEPSELDRERGKRILYLHMLYAKQLDRPVSLAEFGGAVAREEVSLGRRKKVPYSASSVSRWQSGAEPESRTVLAMCRLVKNEVDPGWVVFGRLTTAKAPREVSFTLEELAAARAGGRRGRRRG